MCLFCCMYFLTTIHCKELIECCGEIITAARDTGADWHAPWMWITNVHNTDTAHQIQQTQRRVNVKCGSYYVQNAMQIAQQQRCARSPCFIFTGNLIETQAHCPMSANLNHYIVCLYSIPSDIQIHSVYINRKQWQDAIDSFPARSQWQLHYKRKLLNAQIKPSEVQNWSVIRPDCKLAAASRAVLATWWQLLVLLPQLVDRQQQTTQSRLLVGGGQNRWQSGRRNADMCSSTGSCLDTERVGAEGCHPPHHSFPWQQRLTPAVTKGSTEKFASLRFRLYQIYFFSIINIYLWRSVWWEI